jgi:pimeloyl-ACP methyl ester carboxylesterase
MRNVARIKLGYYPLVVVQSEYDEFIKREHAKYIVESLPNVEFLLLQGVSHFAPRQPLEQFNTAILELSGKVLSSKGGKIAG